MAGKRNGEEKWTDEEAKFVQQWFGILPYTTLAEIVNKEMREVHALARVNGWEGQVNNEEYVRHTKWLLRPFTVIKP